jgi:hypothetical protein
LPAEVVAIAVHAAMAHHVAIDGGGAAAARQTGRRGRWRGRLGAEA